ncbi:hypothetical protein, partial [Streptomyces sp. 8N706]|uniref:hypothetical protein n=1 Tax=Streptomyces sp. 8N706 TaxID=3457416 RepID=UPI003FD35622
MYRSAPGRIQAQHLADLPGGDRAGGLPHRGQDALVLRRQHGLSHLLPTVRDQPHRPTRHLDHRRPGLRALVGELLAHPLPHPLGHGQ